MEQKETLEILKTRLSETDFQKLIAIDNPELHRFIAEHLELLNPTRVFVCGDSAKDIQYVRRAALDNGEEEKLAIAGHTVHFDGFFDQARDKEKTKFLVSPGTDLGPNFSESVIDKEKGTKEIREILKDIMRGRELVIQLFCLAPTNSVFSIPCVQLTDSAYVDHSENLLNRLGSREFVRQGSSARFFKFVHSAGELDERKVSKNLDKRRIYINDAQDEQDEITYTANSQYGGNTIGLKKLAMRLAIKRGSREGWLCEHMLIMGIHGPNGRVTYFTGAFPSLCGKTSTAMLEGETIVGDDIAYLRIIKGEVWGVNVEKGMFGIIKGVNSKDDPLLWEVLRIPGEIIFSNVLVTDDGHVHWIEKDEEIPPEGRNHSGQWWRGKKDADGKEIPCSHRNARFCLSLDLLDNLDPSFNDPEGVPVKGIVYGGRDSDTWVPVEESFNWVHGVITKGASLESETTAATLGREGDRVFNPMSNLDFLSIPIGRYIQNHLDFGGDMENPPHIFSVNYFLKDKNDGKFLNERNDKKVWLKWMELRVHGGVEAIETPTGRIPKYADLQKLFKGVLEKDYTQEDYNQQFTLRVPENLAKIERIEKIYQTRVPDAPKILFEVLEEQKERLNLAREKYGEDYILPDKF